MLFGLAAIAQFTHVSVMMAGFTLGLVLSAAGQPRRLARQLFGMTEGFFGPLFFVWLGSSINLRNLTDHPQMILLGLALGTAAVIAHLAGRAAGLPWSRAIASAGQLGVPVAAVALGVATKALLPGEGAAILLGALVAVVASSVAVAIVSRGGSGGDDRSVRRAAGESGPSADASRSARARRPCSARPRDGRGGHRSG